jgi:hypothetical protein
MLLAGCAVKGDFGRYPYSVIDDKALPVVNRFAREIKGQPVSWQTLTADEESLRVHGFALIRAEGLWPGIEATVMRIEASGIFNKTHNWNRPDRYLNRLNSRHFASIEARLEHIHGHIGNDLFHVTAFIRAMQGVLAVDRHRRVVMRRDRRAFSPEIRQTFQARMAENRQVINKTRRALKEKIAGYRLALTDAQLRGPGARLASIRADLSRLRNRLRRLPRLSGT